MNESTSVVITGVGLACPLGIGREAVWGELTSGRGGFRPIDAFDAAAFPIHLVGTVPGFEAVQYVQPRKSLKVMARETQLAIASAVLARADARLQDGAIDPDRAGVEFGADLIYGRTEDTAEAFQLCTVDGAYDFSEWGTRVLAGSYPLWMLKVLPNMLASHIAINQDVRGPNNTHCLREAGGLSALGEALSVMRRGHADLMFVGGSSGRLSPYALLQSCVAEQLSKERDPSRASRPFDSARDGKIVSEGAATLILETAQHAAARGAAPLAVVRSAASTCEPSVRRYRAPAKAIVAAIAKALAAAEMTPADVGFVSAHGSATIAGDRIEADALSTALPGVPVFAAKSYLGDLGAACGATETAIAALALAARSVPPSIHCDRPDPECPVNVIRGEPLTTFAPACVVVNYTLAGQAVAAVLSAA